MTPVHEYLRCADCGSDLTAALLCSSCGRTYAPDSDGIISALPASLESARARDELEAQIAANALADRNEGVVQYERAFHDEQARYYDSLFGDPLPLRRYYGRLVNRQIATRVRQYPFVVDLCCGTGKSSMPLAQRGQPVVAVDVSREMLRAYRRKCLEAGLQNVVFVHADASRPPLRAGSCGAVIMIGGLHHIPDQAGCIRHCCSILTPSGVLLFHEPLKSGRSSRASRIAENLYAATNPGRVWRAVKRRLGFRVDTVVAAAEPLEDFTPFEKPFSSASELVDLIPPGARPIEIRSQGQLSFRAFEPHLQNALGVPLADLVVTLDHWLSQRGKESWTGDALYAVIGRTGSEPLQTETPHRGILTR